MALFRNSPLATGQVRVNLRDFLCGVHLYASAQSFDFLELVPLQAGLIPELKTYSCPEFLSGWALAE